MGGKAAGAAITIGLALLAGAPAAHAGAAFPLSDSTSAAEPDVAVDAEGNGHFAWVEDGVAKYCRVLSGETACDVRQTLALPTNNGMVARKAFVELPSAGRVVVLVYGCCTNSGPNQTGDYVYDSVTNGDGFLAATSRRGTIEPFDVALGPGETLSASTLQSSDTPTYQDIPFGSAVTTAAAFPLAGVADLNVGVAVTGGKPAIAYGVSDQVFVRRYTGSPGGENSTAGWGPEQLVGPGRAPKLAANDNGLIVGFQATGSGPLQVARAAGAGFDAPLNVSGKRDITDAGLFAVPGSGPDSFYYAAWRDIGTDPDELRTATSFDGSDWSGIVPVVADPALTEADWGQRLRIAGAGGGNGFVTFVAAGKAYAASLDQVDTGSGTAPQSVIAKAKGVVLLGPKSCVKPGAKVKLSTNGGAKGYKVTKAVFSLDKVKKPDSKKPFAQLFSTSGFALSGKHPAKAVVSLKRKKKPHKKVKKTLAATVKTCA
jgi:hypothetical protein